MKAEINLKVHGDQYYYKPIISCIKPLKDLQTLHCRSLLCSKLESM